MESYPFDFTRIGINLGIRAAATTDLTGYSEHVSLMAGSDRSLVVPRLGVCFLKPRTPSKCKWPTRAAAPMVQSTCMMLQPGDDSGNGNLLKCFSFAMIMREVHGGLTVTGPLTISIPCPESIPIHRIHASKLLTADRLEKERD
ncbi:unnamed protein product [Clonostachys chloroleuca]|uniref:Uncharacterized protein n=1 Tax=Clonostachys chloroleuca TaxID=1926264 RepID=A0AA35Q2Q9_9HYPO|nr:unnamed protein product [Clonostachys chloroleuca]